MRPAPTARECGLWQAVRERYRLEAGRELRGKVARQWRQVLDHELSLGTPSWELYPSERAWADVRELAGHL